MREKFSGTIYQGSNLGGKLCDELADKILSRPSGVFGECEFYTEDVSCKEGCKHITVGFADYPDCNVDGKIELTLNELIEKYK